MPFFALIALDVREIGTDHALCASTLGDWLDGLDALGVPAGMVALADCALAHAATAINPPGMGAVSVSLHVDYLRPSPPIGAVISSRTRAVLLDHGIAYSEGPIVDARGEVLASTSLRAFAVPTERMAFAPSARPAEPSPPRLPAEPSAPLSSEPPRFNEGLQLLLATELARRCALGVERVGEADAVLRAVAPPELERSGGVVHGGGVGLLAHLALAGIVAATFGPGEPPRRLDLHVDFLRPVAVGAPLTLHGRVQHRSRRVAVITAEVRNADGRPAALARESCLLT